VEYAQEAHSKGNYFLGQPVEDPGPLFYPVVLLFRTTPLSLIGLCLFVVQLVRRIWRRRLATLTHQADALVLVSLLAFVVLFTTFMSMGSKKFDRYLLPAFPIVDILAGAALAHTLGKAIGGHWRAGSVAVAVASITVLQGIAALPQHPYYLSAYNALAGGPWLAQKALLVGWGEGLEQAADYLNNKPDAAHLRASTFYYRDITTFFKGQGEKLVDDNPENPIPWQGTDYVIFYVNQVQRQIPDPATVAYFQSLTPEYTFERSGIPYIQVYRTPDAIPESLRPNVVKRMRREDTGSGQLLPFQDEVEVDAP
jgi:hypothetical protein